MYLYNHHTVSRGWPKSATATIGQETNQEKREEKEGGGEKKEEKIQKSEIKTPSIVLLACLQKQCPLVLLVGLQCWYFFLRSPPPQKNKLFIKVSEVFFVISGDAESFCFLGIFCWFYLFIFGHCLPHGCNSSFKEGNQISSRVNLYNTDDLQANP